MQLGALSQQVKYAKSCSAALSDMTPGMLKYILDMDNSKSNLQLFVSSGERGLLSRASQAARCMAHAQVSQPVAEPLLAAAAHQNSSPARILSHAMLLPQVPTKPGGRWHLHQVGSSSPSSVPSI
jgi:hypothetical protein